MGQARGHLLLTDHQAGIEKARRHVVPALDGGEDAGAPAHVGAHEGLAEGAGAVGQILALHVDAVEGVWSRAESHGVDVVYREFRGAQRGAHRLIGELGRGFLCPADESGHAGPDDGHFAQARPPRGHGAVLRIAAAPLAEGRPRQPKASPVTAFSIWRGPASPRS